MSEVFNELAIFTKVITPPEEEFKGSKIKPSNYLIQNVDGFNFLLCREIEQTEIEWFKEEKLFLYEGKTYVMLANLPDEEHAMAAINSYWRAIKELSQLRDLKCNTNKFDEEHAKYIEENKEKNKKIAYSYAFNWFGFTYNGLKSDYGFDATIKFNTLEFEADCIGGVTEYLSVRIDLEEEKLITEIDNNPLFKSVEVIKFFIDDTNSKFYKKLSVEEGEALIKEYCRQAKANEIPHIELTGSAIAFSYVD
ncbi:hypothetical protein IEE_05486 [Bacillus cereus BAG5X1-1]|uniref:Uncharacterized protein n=1 Tax=Bacillus cereus BAG5X1-1 TaxID=1053189 RepID=J8A923_BACCE|nr:hypothetical protein [Bacillus cereus]EJQ36010.1 hypothetical protein IEE_05486 [Bacillus cereus BAG5X1-1]